MSPAAGGGYANITNTSAHPPRDSLELASLADDDSDLGTNSRRDSLSSPGGPSSSRGKLSFSDDDPLSNNNNATGSSNRPGARGARTYSMSSTFDFAANLFPLSSTAAAGYAAIGTPRDAAFGPEGGSLERNKSLTYLSGLSLIVNMIIGSGIFSSPKQVNINAGSPGAALIVWTVCGLLAWTGAASYAELGGAIPLNGGAQVYLAKIFGEWAGFLFTWVALVVLKPGSAAIIFIILGEYVVRAFIGAEVTEVSPWLNKGVAMGGLLVATGLNSISTKLGTRTAEFLMFLKFFALLGVAIIGVIGAIKGIGATDGNQPEWKTHGWFAGTSESASQWAVAIYAGLWAYDGWDNTNYVTGEFINPARDLPRCINTALPVVIVSYLMANLAYFFVLPTQVLNSSNTIAVLFGSHVFGALGALIFALVVAGSCFGAASVTTFTAGRLTYAAGKEGYIPEFFGRLGFGGSQSSINLQHRGSGMSQLKMSFADEGGFFMTPINAMLVNACITAVYIIAGDFDTLTTFYGVAGYTFYFFTVLGLIILRVREPALERPYKTWITTPIVFCCVSLFLLSRSILAQPVQTIIVVVFVLAGLPIYFWRMGCRGQRRGQQSLDWKFWQRWGRR